MVQLRKLCLSVRLSLMYVYCYLALARLLLHDVSVRDEHQKTAATATRYVLRCHTHSAAAHTSLLLLLLCLCPHVSEHSCASESALVR
jgi:ABC-type uncharacterized transport system permease subunit